jgi:hypothetical protein
MWTKKTEELTKQLKEAKAAAAAGEKGGVDGGSGEWEAKFIQAEKAQKTAEAAQQAAEASQAQAAKEATAKVGVPAASVGGLDAAEWEARYVSHATSRSITQHSDIITQYAPLQVPQPRWHVQDGSARG